MLISFIHWIMKWKLTSEPTMGSSLDLIGALFDGLLSKYTILCRDVAYKDSEPKYYSSIFSLLYMVVLFIMNDWFSEKDHLYFIPLNLNLKFTKRNFLKSYSSKAVKHLYLLLSLYLVIYKNTASWTTQQSTEWDNESVNLS